MKNLPYLLALHTVDGLGPIRLKRVLDFFEDPKACWEADLAEIKNLGIPENVLEKLSEKRKILDPVNFFEEVKRHNIRVLTIFDETYPYLLKQIYDPPIVIYYKGNLESLEKSFAVVGTRKITGYGKTVTCQLVVGLVQSGFIIVSGLARGVDTIAHKTTLENHGRTIAVLGGGIRKIFPPENNMLSNKIIEANGAIISEYPPDYPHLAGNFPSRNRIIAGLSVATLVTEAAKDSGSLITARQALEQGREVFAVPGPITSNVSEGTASLIKEGAKLVTGIEDILDELGIDEQSSRLRTKLQISKSRFQMSNLSEIERQIISCLENETKHVDEICRKLQKSAPEISAALIKMEILGLVKNLGGGNYTS